MSFRLPKILPLFVAAAAFCAAAAASQFSPLSLKTGSNTAFADPLPEDGQGGWTDQGSNDLSPIKPGRLTLSGIPFDILGDAATGGKSCIVLGGPRRPYLPQNAEIKAGGLSGKFLYLLHAGAWCPPAKDKQIAGLLTVAYADGTSDQFRVRSGRDIGDWANPESHENAFRLWTAYNANTQVSLFGSRFKLEDKPVESVRFEAGDSAWMIVGATIGDDAKLSPLVPDLSLDKTYAAPAAEPGIAPKNGRGSPRNLILIIGDGMGTGAQQLASLYQHGAEGRLFLQGLPIAGNCTTASADSKVTDSAAAATAIATGTKTDNGHLGISPGGKRIVSFAEAAAKSGRSVGLITSDAITGATPAGFFAHVSSRGSYSEVADFAAASGYGILIGNAGGKQWFAGKSSGGKRDDARDLLAEMGGRGYSLIENQTQFDSADPGCPVLGFMADGTLDAETCLARLTGTALQRLSRNPEGFFLMVECTITDKGGHGNNPELSVRGTIQVDWATKEAIDFARGRDDTLVIVTADHETGGLSAKTGPSGKLEIRYSTTGHTGSPVPLFAYGPGAEKFAGDTDNTEIAKTIAGFWGLGLSPAQGGAEKNP